MQKPFVPLLILYIYSYLNYDFLTDDLKLQML